MAQQGTLTNPSTVTQATSLGEEKSLRWFFVGMAALLLVIVAVGFAPSFYLPDTFGPTGGTLTKTALPAYIVAHGVVLSLWYILLLVQPLLVATGRGTFIKSLASSASRSRLSWFRCRCSS